MKEYNVDLVMMNGGDIRGLDGWSLVPQLSHEKGPVLVGVFWGFVGDEILSSCMGIITNYHKDQPAADWNYQFML